MICNPIYPHECAYNNPLGPPLSPPLPGSLFFSSFPTTDLHFLFLFLIYIRYP